VAAAKSSPARRKNDIRRTLFAAACLLTAHVASAGAIDKLHRFLDTTRTVRADFAQTVVARNGSQAQVSSGVMMLSRPGKFRWQIEKPYHQLLLGDGEKVWIHDPDLRQVTVRKAGRCAGRNAGRPARRRQRDRKGLHAARSRRARPDWSGSKRFPRVQDSGFERSASALPATSCARWSCSTASARPPRWSFSRLERNPRLAPSLFRFTPPANTDVIGD
jgi:outer membrane lipoprotein carrier protein